MGDQRYHVRKFMERCTLHGVSEILNASWLPLKVFWVLTFCAALAAAVYGCAKIVIEFLDAPVVVSYVVNDATNLTLPDIVICPFNRFNASYFAQIGISEEVADHLEQLFGMGGNLYKFQHNRPPLNASLYVDKLNDLLEGLHLTFAEFIDKATLSCESIIDYCVYQWEVINCCQNATTVWTFGGRCYRLIGLNQVAPGYGFGMTIVANLPYSLYRPTVNTLHIDGLLFKLAEKDKGTDYDMTFVSAGTHALIPLRATKYSFINDPPRYTCKKVSQAYSRVSCFDECVFERGMNACQCRHIASSGDMRPCTPIEFETCLLRQTQAFMIEMAAQNDSMMSYCRRRCGPACQYWQYTASVTYANFPSPTIQKFLMPGENYNNSLILEIYFEQLEYTEIKHHMAMTADTFIANLGGQIGLWVGGSILTVLQVLVFVVQLCVCKPRTTVKKKAESSNGVQHKQSDSASHRLTQTCTSCNGTGLFQAHSHFIGRDLCSEATLNSLMESSI